MKRQDLDDLAVGFASWGEFRGIRYETEAVDAEDPAVLHLHYVCTFGDRNYLFEVSFGFAGLEVHLFAFRWDLVKLAP